MRGEWPGGRRGGRRRSRAQRANAAKLPAEEARRSAHVGGVPVVRMGEGALRYGQRNEKKRRSIWGEASHRSQCGEIGPGDGGERDDCAIQEAPRIAHIGTGVQSYAIGKDASQLLHNKRDEQ